MLATGSASEEMLYVNAAGRRVPLGFAREDRAIYVVARERGAQWPIELLRQGRAELVLPEGRAEGSADLLSNPDDRTRVLALFHSKYGDEKFARWYENPSRVIRIRLDTGSEVPVRPAYYTWITAEFDNVADDYDHHITGNRINRLLRDRSLRRLRALFAGRRRILEIGCGSGMETIPLLREGHELVAVDVSERMLDVVRHKARGEGFSEQLTTVHAAARDLSPKLEAEAPGAFEGAYSTYGAINCEPDISPVARALGAVLLPRSPLLLGIYNRWCLAELVGYSLTLHSRRAFGRRRNPVPVGTSRFCVDVFAYSVADIQQIFQNLFEREALEGVPVVLPPSDLVAYAEKFSRHFDLLANWDARLGLRWPLNHLGDHFLITLRRRAAEQ